MNDPGRLRELELFVSVLETGSFSAAARLAGMTPSAVSKAIARLERRLGVRLVMRSTRGLAPTAEGRDFATRGQALIAALDEAEQEASGRGRPRGRVHVSTSASYAVHVLYPALPVLLDAHPALAISVSQTDAVIDLLETRADIAIRAGEMPSSGLFARSLGRSALAIVASPHYLKRRGIPHRIEALREHALLGFSYARRQHPWSFGAAALGAVAPLPSRLQASDGEGLRHMALAGLGIARLARFAVREDVAAGRLVELLADADDGAAQSEPFHAVWVGGGGLLPTRIRVVLDHLATAGRVDLR